MMLIGLTGCAAKEGEGKSEVSGDEVVSVTLACARGSNDAANVPFAEKTYEDQQEMTSFLQTIEKAEKMDGILNYVSMFHMTVSYESGTQQKYVLNIADDDESNGLLVRADRDHQGYEILKDQAQALSELIYP